jgi:hypothetical protein
VKVLGGLILIVVAIGISLIGGALIASIVLSFVGLPIFFLGLTVGACGVRCFTGRPAKMRYNIEGTIEDFEE